MTFLVLNLTQNVQRKNLKKYLKNGMEYLKIIRNVNVNIKLLPDGVDM